MLKDIMNISKNFIAMMIFLLLKRSAKMPAVEEKSKKGITKIAPAEANIVVA